MERLKENIFWRDQNILVTGATGLLGSWLTQALAERGANVVALVRDGVPRSNFERLGLKDRVTIVRGEIEDFACLARTLTEYEIESVVHLAAQTIVGVANKSPLSTFESNIKGTWCLMEACRLYGGVKRIVVSTSDKAYGEQEQLPYKEDMPLQGSHPYDVSKSCADLISQAYYKSYKLPVCIIRCANFFGGGDLNFNRLIPGTIRSVVYGERPIIRSDGKSIRDYLFVQDGVGGILRILQLFERSRLGGEAFNLGMGLQMSALRVVQTLLRLMDRTDLKPKILNKASNEIPRQYLSNKKALSTLRWRPEETFEGSLQKTIDWYRLFLQQG